MEAVYWCCLRARRSSGARRSIPPPDATFPGGEPITPPISIFPSTVVRGQSYTIFGRQFNGLSQAAGYGDENETATNYPLVRIKNVATGHIFYAKTHDHSTMAVATGAVPTFTHFDVPAGMETGPSTLVVVANGIPSNPVNITVN